MSPEVASSSIVSESKMKSNSSITQDQTLLGSSDLLSDIPHYIMAVKNQTGTWNMSLHSSDSKVYLGLAGGLAGIGNHLIKYSTLETDLTNQSNKDLALDLAIEIGRYLGDQAIVNGTGTYWPIYSGSTRIDLGYDFGIAGIISFMSTLHNQTGDTEFSDLATDGLQAIVSSSNSTGGLHWASPLIDVITDSNWYPNDEIIYLNTETYQQNHENTYFTGKALGSLGVVQASFDVISVLDITDQSTNEWDILNSSLQWVVNNFISSGSEISFPLSIPSIGIASMSQSNGVSGAVDLLLDIHAYTANDTYLNLADGMINWLNGTDSNINRFRYSKLINGSLSTQIQLGLTHGVAGNINTLNKYIQYQNTDAFDSRMTSLIFYLNNFGSETSAYYKYPERQEGGSGVNPGSLSYGYGGGGILPLLDNLASEYNITSITSDIEKGKSYLYSRAVSNLGFDVIPRLTTGEVELNPSLGVPSSFYVMLVTISGQLDVATNTLDFGSIRTGKSLSKSILLQNLGDENISASWTGLMSSTIFVSGSYSVSIPARSNYSLFISFIPPDEGQYDEVIDIFSSGGTTFEVSLSGLAFDLPTMTLLDHPENNSMITDRNDITFRVNATDSSLISEVTISINNQSREMTTTEISDIYEATWDLDNIQNGTYTIVFTATDSLGNSVVKTLQYTVGIYDPPLKERVFSQTTLYILIGVTLVLLVAAIAVTRYYMS